MAAFACCFWWCVFGILVGWVLNWLLSKLLRKEPPAAANNYSAGRVAAVPASAAARPVAGRVDLDAARRAGYALRNVDDISVIDGIGPKIEALYREHGVTTFAQIAKMSLPDLQKILDAGGSNFKLANPASWAQQAQLILDNRWGDLKTLHAQLAAIAKTTDGHHKL